MLRNLPIKKRQKNPHGVDFITVIDNVLTLKRSVFRLNRKNKKGMQPP
ncbi:MULTISPECIES: hypothetical protein [unclassified Wolbachia]|nr:MULTISPECIES: hypothetical protein [unclassified Wolbachia]